MNLTQEQINAGVSAGLALTNPEEDKIYVPMKHAAGALILRTLMVSLANGELSLQSVPGMAPPAGSIPPPARKNPRKRAVKKVGKKVRKKR